MNKLPKYKCHKVVSAAKIYRVDSMGVETTRLWLQLSETTITPHDVKNDFLIKHKPEADGYFVVYEDGYESYSPAKAFEAGYSLIKDGEQP